jgi:hypothetical protein
MKPINTYLIKLTGLLLLAITLQSCMEQPGTWKNDQIKAGKRDDFHELNDKVFKAIKANDLVAAKLFMSKEMIDNTYTRKLVELVGNGLTDNKYSLLDEYYVVNKFNDLDTIKAKSNATNSYSLYYSSAAREMYFAFYVSTNSVNRFIISTVYAKYSYGWKLNDLDIAPYTINGKTAPELYKLAKEEYDKKYLIAAVNNAALALTCVRPISIWQYPDEGDISDFNSKIINEANQKYKFPFLLNQLPTKPMILKVYNQKNDNGYFPMVYYMTHIKISDTTAVKNENIQIKKILYKAMPGIEKDTKYVFYEAFNKFPNSSESVDRFDMVDKTQ